MAVEHPAKIDAPVDPICEPDDFHILTKALPDRKNARNQQRCVDRRDFAVPTTLTGFRIQPVIEPAALMKGPRIKESKRVACALECLLLLNPVATDCDAEPS